MDVGSFNFDSHSTDWDYGILVCCAIRPFGYPRWQPVLT